MPRLRSTSNDLSESGRGTEAPVFPVPPATDGLAQPGGVLVVLLDSQPESLVVPHIKAVASEHAATPVVLVRVRMPWWAALGVAVPFGAPALRLHDYAGERVSHLQQACDQPGILDGLNVHGTRGATCRAAQALIVANHVDSVVVVSRPSLRRRPMIRRLDRTLSGCNAIEVRWLVQDAQPRPLIELRPERDSWQHG